MGGTEVIINNVISKIGRLVDIYNFIGKTVPLPPLSCGLLIIGLMFHAIFIETRISIIRSSLRRCITS